MQLLGCSGWLLCGYLLAQDKTSPIKSDGQVVQSDLHQNNENAEYFMSNSN